MIARLGSGEVAARHLHSRRWAVRSPHRHPFRRKLLARRSPLVLLGVTILLALGAPSARAVTLPPNFVVENAVPGVAFDTPVGLAFLPDGRMLVAEKRGVVWVVRNGVKLATPMWSRESEVLNEHDRGLLGIAVDPNFYVNHFVYFLYTVDPDSDSVDGGVDTFGRLVRYRTSTSDSNVVDASSRAVLIGVNWRAGIPSGSPSHTIGSLVFGRDGSLLVSAGDGAQFNSMDQGGQDNSLFGPTKTDPYEDIGAFRAQYVGSLAGKVLRINPANGHGYASNPFVDGNLKSVRSRVWCYGLRNPYRMTLRPGTGSTDTSAANPGTLYIGDVGWSTWEETNVARQGGINFGWPCYEGFGTQPSYQAASPAHNGCDSFGTSTNPAQASPPLESWHHNTASLSVPPGFKGNASVAGAFYTGTNYPASYRNQYFFADYGQNWIKVAVMNASDQLQQVLDFADSAEGPVAFAAHPSTQDLYYVSIYTGQVRRIRYTGSTSNLPPVANATGAPTSGPAPLSVSFSSTGTSDPDGDPLTLTWSFGDGQSSNAAAPSHVYSGVGSYDAVLTVDDGRGGVARDTVRVTVTGTSAFPTTPVLDDFNRPDGPIGNGWLGYTAGLAIRGNALTQTTADSWTVWPTVFGSTQEAFFTFRTITEGAPEHDLMLKVQGPAWSDGHIEVRYDDVAGGVYVNTYTPGVGWQARGGPFALNLVSGDRFGARAWPDGTVQLFRNGALVATASVSGWAYAGQGGRLGMTLVGASQTLLEDYGGGNAVLGGNTPPTAFIDAPVENSFYALGDTVRLEGHATDAETPGAGIALHWEVQVHHNNHLHPSAFVADGPSAWFLAEDHDDGTGVNLEIQLRATDGGGLADTAQVDIFPAIDLNPGPVTTVPSTPGTTAPATWSFRIRNLGGMPAPISRWRLISEQGLLAEGDTIVAPHDSVAITRTLPPTLATGTHTVRVRVDTLGVVFETDETNNASTRSLIVVSGAGPDEAPPQFRSGPTAEPAGVVAFIRWSTDERASGTVRYGRNRSLPDSVTVPMDTVHVAELDNLQLNRKYYFRVSASDAAGNTTIAALDSFVTQNGPLAVGDEPLRFALSGAHPNPTRLGVAFGLDLPRAARVELSIHDPQGRAVWRRAPKELPAGHHRLEWPGRDAHDSRVRPGLYFARIEVDGRTYARRFAVMQ